MLAPNRSITPENCGHSCLFCHPDHCGVGAYFGGTRMKEKDEFVRALLQDCFGSMTKSISANLSCLTGGSVTLGTPKVTSLTDSYISSLPTEVMIALDAKFISGYSGDHLFILDLNSAKLILSLMTKEDILTFDEMCFSILSEVISQLIGTQIQCLTSKTGNKSIAADFPYVIPIKKAADYALDGSFALTYPLELGDGVKRYLIEIISERSWKAIVDDIKAPSAKSPTGKDSTPDFATFLDALGNDEVSGMKFDGDKLRWDLLPIDAIQEAVKRYTHGVEKYAPDNWQRVDDPVNRYYGALQRHLAAWRMGEKNGSGLPIVITFKCSSLECHNPCLV